MSEPTNPIPERIVAEVSTNWRADGTRDPVITSRRFETIINHNREKGYELESWKMQTTYSPAQPMTSTRCGSVAWMNETIIAVFVKRV